MSGPPSAPSFVLSAHAARVVAERALPLQWIERVLQHPERTEPDSVDPVLRHALARIPEYDGRVLRVVYNPTVTPPRVVAVIFDRRLRNRL